MTIKPVSRKYLNDRWCVRCNRCEATPYLRHNIALLPKGQKYRVVDLGCGNMRNTIFMRAMGYQNIVPLDMAPPNTGVAIILGKEPIPVKDSSVAVVLANFVLMFLNARERAQVIREIKRIAAPGCVLINELYAAKDSYTPTKEKMIEMNDKLFSAFITRSWKRLRKSQDKFIVRKIK